MNQVSQNPRSPNPLKFRLSFIALPLVCLLATIGLSAIFYSQLPDNVYFRFDFEGNPSGDPLAKTSFLALMITIQGMLTFLSFVATSAIGKVQTLLDNVDKFQFSPTRLLTLMGNMPAIIQVILAYILVDAIIYAQRTEHLIPVWIFAVGTLVIGGIIVLVYGLPIAIKGYKSIIGVEGKKKD